MQYGKTIELFYVNGTTQSIITAELSNWNGKAIKIPRNELNSCARDDVRNPGVYFLLCKEDDGSDSVYIGEAENVFERLQQHMRDYKTDKEPYFWSSAVIFIGRDLNKAHIRYIENALVVLARESNKYKVLTKSSSKNVILKESQVAVMKEFIDNIQILMTALGFSFLEKAPTSTQTTTLFVCAGSNYNAQGFISAGGFTVLKGSKVVKELTPGFYNHCYSKLRKELEDKEIIVDGVFTDNFEFNAPSAASSIVLGRASNGKLEWRKKDSQNIKLKDVEI